MTRAIGFAGLVFLAIASTMATAGARAQADPPSVRTAASPDPAFL
jgi:hypothetical protein